MVIKAGDVAKIKPMLSTLNLSDHLEKANAMVGAARREADRIVGAAQRESETTLEEARREGYERGYREGYEAGETTGRADAFAESTRKYDEQQASLTRTLEELISNLDARKADLERAARRDLLEFAVKIASRLTYAMGEHDTEAVKANFERALAAVSSMQDVDVHAHPEDVKALETWATDTRGRLDQARAVRIVPDEAVRRGGCVVRSGMAEIDATLDTQVERMVELMRGRRSGDDDTM